MKQQKYHFAFERRINELEAQDFLKKETVSFLRRNILFSKPNKAYCCPQCLKAFLIIKSKEAPSPLIDRLIKNMRCEAGHNGYFLDSGELKSLFKE